MSRIPQLLARVATLGLVAAGSAVLAAAPTQAANNADVYYICDVPMLKFKSFVVTADLADVPTAATVGEPLTSAYTATIQIPEPMSNTIRSMLKATEYAGSVTPEYGFNGQSVAGSAIAVPRQALPTSGPIPVTVSGELAYAAPHAGTVVVTDGAFLAELQFWQDGGTSAGAFKIPCTPNGPDPVVINEGQPEQATVPGNTPESVTEGSIEVAQATTTTKVTQRNIAKGKVAKSKVVVKTQYGSTATGKVKVTLKKGTKTVKTVTKTLNSKGKATVRWGKLKATGKYKVIAKYLGDADYLKSAGRTTFKVTRS